MAINGLNRIEAEKEQRVLIVDDNVAMSKTLSDILQMIGFNIHVAESGEEGIEKVKEWSFDIILMDVKLPGMNGIDAFKEIKKIRPNTMVIIMTAYTTEGLIKEAQNEGAFSILHKPFEINDMLTTMESATVC